MQRAERPESMAPADDHVIVLFGATGDLARRELLPGLFHLAKAGLLPARYRIIGTARSGLTDDEFRQRAKDAVTEFGLAEPTGEAWRRFADSLSFGAAQPTDPQPLLDAVAAAEKALGGHPRRLFHRAVPPAAFGSMESLDFPGTVYGVARGTPATERMSRQVGWLSAQADDRVVEG
jgi:glucose-6-phosphate 1-dehydrogenase